MNGKKRRVVMMAAVAVSVLVALAVVLLTLPKAPATKSSGEPSSSSVAVIRPIVSDRVTFTATVLNVRNGALLVNADGALCWVTTDVQSDVPVPTVEVGDIITVVHNGVVAESYPGQINYVYEIHLASGEYPVLSYTLVPTVSKEKKVTLLTQQDNELGCSIYYYGLEGMDVTVEEQTMSLQQALAVGVVSAEYLLDQAKADAKAGKNEQEVYDDGGSVLYRYEDYAILKMHTLDGDNTLYIGTADMTLPLAVQDGEKDEKPRIVVSESDEEKITRVSTWRTATETDYIVYYVNVDSVQVMTDVGYVELIDGIHRELIDMSALRSELIDLARESDKQGALMFCDGRLENGDACTETRIQLDDYAVTFVGYQGRREAFFCAPDAGGRFDYGVLDRIAEETGKYPLTVNKTEEANLTKITCEEWGLDYDVYYYGINSASVTVDEKTVDLPKAISGEKLTFEQLLADAEALGDIIYHTTYSDGGSVLYRYEDYAILKMHTLDGDNTLYIGTAELTPNVI